VPGAPCSGLHPTMNPTLSIPISPGELLDKITILQIKFARISNPQQRRNVRHELDLLTGLWSTSALAGGGIESRPGIEPEVERLRGELKGINETLWEIEDAIRECERDSDFGPRFIELARAVYKTNDRRAAVKRAINETLDSTIIEEKSYKAY